MLGVFIHDSQNTTKFSYCYRLRVLDLGAVIIHGDISAILEEVADNLEVFSLEDTSWVDPNASKLVGWKESEDGQNYFRSLNTLLA